MTFGETVKKVYSIMFNESGNVLEERNINARTFLPKTHHMKQDKDFNKFLWIFSRLQK